MKRWIFMGAVVAIETADGFAVFDGKARVNGPKPHFIWRWW